MSETLLSLLKKKKDPVKMKKVGIKAPKKGEVRVETTIVDKTEEASDIDMTDFRQRLKLNKNKTYRTLVNESKRQQEKDMDLISKPGISIPSQLDPVELPKELSRIEEKTEEPSQVPSVAETLEDVEREVDDIVQPSASVSSKKPKATKVTKIKSKMTLPGAELSDRADEPLTEQKTKKTRKSRTKKPIETVDLDIPATMIQIGDKPIGERLGKKEPNVFIKAPAYYMNNREIFINFLNSLFKPYADRLKAQKDDDISCEKMSEAKQKSFSLMVHQQIVRDYMNVYSPYRGLLLYHGLGAGKTCASIGIAEGLKDVKQVIIMTPASLRMNYVSELKHCGDPIYKINQYWEFIETNGIYILKKH